MCVFDKGPEMNSRLGIGTYLVRYEATDSSGNVGYCDFTLIVADRQAPTITSCPQDTTITVYPENNYAAYPNWDQPEAVDHIDGNVPVSQISGVPSGTKLMIR